MRVGTLDGGDFFAVNEDVAEEGCGGGDEGGVAEEEHGGILPARFALCGEAMRAGTFDTMYNVQN